MTVMRTAIYISILWLCAALLTGCADNRTDEPDLIPSGKATFSLDTAPIIDGNVTSRAEATEEKPLKGLWFVLTDSRGNVLSPHYSKVSPDFKEITIEGLAYGDYTIAFLATTSENHNGEVATPGTISSPWLENNVEGKAIDGEFYYKKLNFSIGKSQEGFSRQVSLELCVSKVSVSLKMPSEYLRRFVVSASITLDDGCTVPAALTPQGLTDGSASITAHDITETMSLCTLAPDEPLSGYVEVKSRRDDGSEFLYRYRFEYCQAEAGKVSHITLDYRHPDIDDGTIVVRDGDYQKIDTDTMFLADEPREVFYDASRRSFRVNAPLQVSITPGHRLGIKFFAPATLKNVTVKCRFNSISHEFVELARIETIYPFMEAEFDIPVVKRECTFVTTSGRRIRVPVQSALSASDVTLRIETDDPFMAKIAEIDSRWYIRFSPYGADNGHAYWRHMDPLLCRHGVALALNMAYMFSSDYFNTALEEYDGILLDNGHNPINLDALRTRIRNHGGLVLGRVVGVGGLGGGSTYGLADYCYKGVYFDATPAGSNPHNYARQAMFHEYGHCLGYSHSSNMTYGDKWTVLCAKVFVEMGTAGMLPVNSRLEVESLPY